MITKTLIHRALELDVARISQWAGLTFASVNTPRREVEKTTDLLDIVIIRSGEMICGVALCIDNIILITGKEKGNNDLNLQLRNSHTGTRMATF
jgi:hypothetical protein